MQELIIVQPAVLRQLLREEVMKVFKANIKALKKPQKEILPFDEAALYLGFSKSHLYKLTSQGEITFSKRSKKIYFERTNLDEFLLANKIDGLVNLKEKANDFLTQKKG